MTMQQPDRYFHLDESSTHQFMLVTIDDFNMVIPREHIKTFQSAHDMETGDLSTHSIGWIRFAGNKLPVYCFTGDFELSEYMLEKRPVCVLLSEVDVAFMCSDIKVLNYPVEHILPMPECISCSTTPVEAVCLYQRDGETRTAMLCSRESMKKYIVATSR